MTERNPTTDDITQAIDQEQAAWRALVAEVGEERMLEPGPMGEWTFKDLAAHLTGWRERSLRFLEFATRGEPQPPPPWPAELKDDVDAINEWIYTQNHHRSLEAVLADADVSFERLSTAVQALPADELWDRQRFSWLKGAALGEVIVDRSFFGHFPEEHESAVRAWLTGTMNQR